MKKLLLLLLPFLLFSYEIDFSKKFTKDLLPDILTANISISIEDSEEKIVIKRLEKFNKEIKKYDKIDKTMGNFNVRPLYQHASKTPTIYAYKGILNYTLETMDAIFMGEFVSLVTSLKNNRDTTISLNNLSWKVKEESYKVTLDALRLEAIIWIEEYSKILSKDINKECKIKNINLTDNYQPHYASSPMLRMDSSFKKEKMLVPEISKQNISINTTYKIECE